MTVGFAAGTVNGWLDGTFATATCWQKLHTADPGAAGATAAAAGDTTRKQSTMSAASAGSKAQSGTAPVWTNGGTTETLTHISNWSASTAGTFQASGAITGGGSWASGYTATLTAFTVSVSPIAA